MDKVVIGAARHRAFSIPLDEVDVSDLLVFQDNTVGHYFARLRRDEAPVHYCKNSAYGPYWSVTKYHDIVKVETSHPIFSSECLPRAVSPWTSTQCNLGLDIQMFIAMDPPQARRAASRRCRPVVAPDSLAQIRSRGIRERGETSWMPCR